MSFLLFVQNLWTKLIKKKQFALQDPTKNFGLPSIGRIYKYIEPTHIPDVSQARNQISVLYIYKADLQ